MWLQNVKFVGIRKIMRLTIYYSLMAEEMKLAEEGLCLKSENKQVEIVLSSDTNTLKALAMYHPTFKIKMTH